MPNEITIKISNDLKSLVKKAMVYEDIQASASEPRIASLVEAAKSEFNDDINKVAISIKLVED